jgi:hypothetical protein
MKGYMDVFLISSVSAGGKQHEMIEVTFHESLADVLPDIIITRIHMG